METLHGLAQTLLTHASALSQFNADPQAMLDDLGLTDVAPVDVTELMGLLQGGIAALPNASGVFEQASGLLSATGLNTVVDTTLHGVAGTVDMVADSTAGVPLVGPLTNAAALDSNALATGVSEHLDDGKLVGAIVDGTTNHLADSATATTAVETVRALPAVGEPLGGALDSVRAQGDALLEQVNGALGSTPIGASIGMESAAAGAGAPMDSAPMDNVTGAVTGDLPVDVPTDLPVDVPAVGGVDNLPVGGVTETVGAVTDTVGGVVDTVGGVTGGLNVPGVDSLPVVGGGNALDIGL